MPSTTLTDYQILSDGNFTLKQPGAIDKVLKFAVPDDIHLGTALMRRQILAFKVRPYEDSVLTVSLDHEAILRTSFDASHTRAYWEVVDLREPLVQSPNKVDVRFFLNDGHARFGDVIIWYQVNK